MDAAQALKSSLCQELETIETPSIGYHFGSSEDWLGGHSSGMPAVAGEDFSVDDLLDFSNGELEVIEGEEEEEGEEEKDSPSVSSTDGMDDDRDSNSGSLTGNGEDSDSLLASELAVPVDDIAELEWVSHFVDDSLPELSLRYPTTINKWKLENTITGSQTGPTSLTPPCFLTPVPVKARTKRSRTGTRQTSMSQSSEASSTSSCSIWSSPNIDFLTGPHEEPERKRKKKTKAAAQTGLVQFQRRCSHCLVQKTPQWRTGPLGPKTLCNACGVRYKSGRLFPEYRPACSPTFSVEIHSNSHRKVLEMRRKKEVLTEPQGGFAPMVSSF